jgi:hypothetical protein
MGSPTIDWDEAAEIFGQFCIFVGQPEMRWFKKAWQGFIDAGKASYDDDVQMHWVLARIVTLGIVFNEFCEKAWEEGGDPESLICELQSNENRFNLVRLGNIVEPDVLSADADQADSFCEAMSNLVYRCRTEVYETLLNVFGNPSTLFVSLWLSSDEEVEVGKYTDELFNSTVNHDLTGQKMCAFDYVCNGMFGLDA